MLFLKRFLTAAALFIFINPLLTFAFAAASGGLEKVPGKPVPHLALLSLDAKRTAWQENAPLFLVISFGLSLFGVGLLSFSNLLPWCREVPRPPLLPGSPAHAMEQ